MCPPPWSHDNDQPDQDTKINAVKSMRCIRTEKDGSGRSGEGKEDALGKDNVTTMQKNSSNNNRGIVRDDMQNKNDIKKKNQMYSNR